MAEVRMSLEEYTELLRRGDYLVDPRRVGIGKGAKVVGTKRTKRKASAYSKRYGAAFKRIAPKNKKKGGGWKAGGFARTQKAAHRAAKR
jgi:hypothetical protein